MKKNFSFFFGFNALLFCLQTSFIVIKSSSFASSLPLPKDVYWELGYTVYIQCFLFFLLSLAQTAFLGFFLSFNPPIKRTYLGAFIYVSTWFSILFIHTKFFPLSHYSQLITSLGLYPIVILAGFVGLLTVMIMIFYMCAHASGRDFLSFSLLCLGAFLFLPSSDFPQHHSEKPNVFIIGVDSLNLHLIDAQRTPTLFAIKNQNVWFEDTISPLARTYPAWSTILSGAHPFHHKARYNLMPADHASDKSIAWRMKKSGYATYYATDDRRFNLLDTTFGFDKIIGPQTGVNDMLMGTFNDFILGNFFINTSFGRWFFPYNHMNRASYFSYYPETFDNALKKKLTQIPVDQPIFMAVHFTLPHWPYAYASSKHPSAKGEHDIQARAPLYEEALFRVDQQVKVFLNTLQQRGFLNKALVIVLSDHGETLYTPGSRALSHEQYQGHGTSGFETYLVKKTATPLDRSAGHGSDLLSPDQFHCFFVIQKYEQSVAQYKPHHIQDRVMLSDIAPTLSDYLELNSPNQFDGISLRARIEKDEPLPKRSFILESGMFPNRFLSRSEAKEIAPLFFTVDHQMHLHIRKDKIATLDEQKLYAILNGNWILAFYPDENHYIRVLQNIETGEWTDDLSSSFSKKSPAMSLLKELEQFYAKPDFAAS